jgi:hypothetical protein
MAPLTPEQLLVSRPTIVFVAGWGRSGSTLLEGLLAASDGVATLGESNRLWSSHSPFARRCSCGSDLISCPIWSEILDSFHTEWSKLVSAMNERQRTALRIRRLPRLLLAKSPPASAQEYAAVLAVIYRRFAAATGSETIIDAAKLPTVLAGLSTQPDADLRVVHLLRDPRAVAHSWTRNRSVEWAGSTMTMRRYTPTASLWRWAFYNGLVRLVIHVRRLPFLAVSYEQLVRHDPMTVKALAEFTGIPLDRTRGLQVSSNTHAIAGNLGRASGPLVVTEDDEWRTALPLRYRLLGTLELPLYWAMTRRSRPRQTAAQTTNSARTLIDSHDVNP